MHGGVAGIYVKNFAYVASYGHYSEGCDPTAADVPRFGEGSVVRATYNRKTGEASFVVNGQGYGVAFRNLGDKPVPENYATRRRLGPVCP